VNPHAIHIEGSNRVNQIDNNVFYKIKGGVLIRDTNNLIVAQNLFIDSEDAGVTSTSGLRGQPRPVGGHTNDGRGNRVYNNIFHNTGRVAIEFTNVYNQADGNAYSRMPMNGFLRILRPEPQEWLDLEYWREQHGWDKAGAMVQFDAALDPETLELTLTPRGKLAQVPLFNGIDTDLFGRAAGTQRVPGPFADLAEGYKGRNIDPRKAVK